MEDPLKAQRNAMLAALHDANVDPRVVGEVMHYCEEAIFLVRSIAARVARLEHGRKPKRRRPVKDEETVIDFPVPVRRMFGRSVVTRQITRQKPIQPPTSQPRKDQSS